MTEIYSGALTCMHTMLWLKMPFVDINVSLWLTVLVWGRMCFSTQHNIFLKWMCTYNWCCLILTKNSTYKYIHEKCLPYKTSQKFKCNLNKKVMTEIYSGALTCLYAMLWLKMPFVDINTQIFVIHAKVIVV
jgi:hypothetical protein